MNIEQITPVLLKDAQKNDYAGQDPFDGLNSSLFKLAPSLKNGLFGLVWIQLHKRLAINIRLSLIHI